MGAYSAKIDVRVTSVNGSQANGPPIRIGGREVTWQIEAPAALAGIESSNDAVTWDSEVATSGDNTGLITSRCEYIRPIVASDAGGPRVFSFAFRIHKEV